MERFLAQHHEDIAGVLSGFDRLVFGGTLNSINNPQSLNNFLRHYHVLYKDFAAFVSRLSEEIKAHAQALAQAAGRPYQYLNAPSADKEAIAREIAARDGVTSGLICVLGCVEKCNSFDVRGDWSKRRWPVKRAVRQCLHFYFYYLDRDFGLMHVRLQSWLPFTIQVGLNGRHCLGQRLSQEGIGFVKRGNCVTQADNLPRAQQLLDELTTRDWVPFLNTLAHRVNPVLDSRYGLDKHGYYWTVYQSEYATDVLFGDTAGLQAVYPKLVAHAVQGLSCEDILRFLERNPTAKHLGDVSTDCRRRRDGIRVKHRVGSNSIKMYDKHAQVLRIETTVNDPGPFKVRREAIHQGQRVMALKPMRKGVVDLARRAEVSRRANERYLEALAVVGRPQPVAATLDAVSQRVVRQGRPYRSLRPLTAEEATLFQALMHGEFLIYGFRNQDLRRLLWPTVEAGKTKRQTAGRMTRWLRLLRAHGLIRKVPHTRWYRLTPKGQHLMTLTLKLRQTDLAQIAA